MVKITLYALHNQTCFFTVYGKNLGINHGCTKKAGHHYMKMRLRVKMYNKICGGSSHIEKPDIAPTLG
jgi:hypothetical protein